MKSFKEWSEIVSATYKALKEAEAASDEKMPININNKESFIAAHKAGTPEYELMEAWNNRITEASVKAEYLKKRMMYESDNRKHAFFAEVITPIYEEFRKWQGKPYGEKTEQKIAEAIKARINCKAYISKYNSSRQTIRVYTLNAEGYYSGLEIEIGSRTAYDYPLLKENRINMPDDIADLKLEGIADPVENIDERIKQLGEARAKAKTLKDELEKACAEYNKLTPTALEHISMHDIWKI